MRKLLVEVQVPLTEEEEKERALAILEGKDEEDLPTLEKLQGYLHHWGQDSDIVTDEKGMPVGVNTFTVAIVEEVETGQMHTFHPTQLKILNYTTYR